MHSETVMFAATLVVSLTALILSVFNLQHLEVPIKRAAAILAESLRLAEPLVPFFRTSSVDNHVRDALVSLAQSDSFFRQSLEATGETAEHVADVLPILDPTLQTLAKAIAAPTDQSRSLMATVVHRVKNYDLMVNEIRGELQRLI